MLFKYWIDFDGDGEIKTFYKSKSDCKVPCKEYIVKLIPVDRKNEELIENIDQTTKAAQEAVKGIKKLETEVHKAIKDLRRLKI